MSGARQAVPPTRAGQRVPVPLVTLGPLQAVPAPEPLPDAPLPPPDAAPALGHGGVLPAPVHGDALLHLLLPGGIADPYAPSGPAALSGP